MDYYLTIFLVIFFSFSTFSSAQENLIIEEGDGIGCFSSEETSEETGELINECAKEFVNAYVDVIEKQHGMLGFRRKRSTEAENATFHRMDGCLIHCVLGKYNILDKDGIPSKSGLLQIITDGVTDKNYHTVARSAVDQCYQDYSDFRHQLAKRGPKAGRKYCDVAYDTYECLRGIIDQYCDSITKK